KTQPASSSQKLSKAAPHGPWKKILLKISGEAFCKEGGHGIDAEETGQMAEMIKAIARPGRQLAVVVGGGNIIRGSQLSQTGINRSTADYMGMLATIINGVALQ